MVKPNVSHCVSENEVHYNAYTFADEYLTFIALENGTLSFEKYVQYSLDNGETWSESVMEEGNTELTITTGDKIMCKFEVTQEMIEQFEQLDSPTSIIKFTSSGRINVQGNIMSILYGDNFVGQTSLINNLSFYRMFRRCDVVSAENLILPATTLVDGCYIAMFYDCQKLITAPKLPATTLASNCYRYMFYDCTSLTIAPELPATTLAESCYEGMFDGCTSLTTAPALPATTLRVDCYSEMFGGCTSLTSAPELPATTLAEYCYSSMFWDCTSLTTAPELPATTLVSGCYQEMFYGCTNLTTASTVPNVVKPVNRTYCDAMYAYSNVPQSSDYDSCAYEECTQQEPETD